MSVPDWDVHFLFSGFFPIEAETEEEARELANEWLAEHAEAIYLTRHLNVVDSDNEYATDILPR